MCTDVCMYVYAFFKYGILEVWGTRVGSLPVFLPCVGAV